MIKYSFLHIAGECHCAQYGTCWKWTVLIMDLSLHVRLENFSYSYD